MRKRVCFFLGTDGDYGGAGRILLNLIRNLDLARFEPLVMVSAEGGISEEMGRRRIEWRIWPRHDGNRLLTLLLDIVRCARFFRRERIAVVHMNHGCLGWRPAEMPAAWLAGVPLAVHFQRIVRNPTPYLKYASCALTCSEYVAKTSGLGRVPAHVVRDLVQPGRFGSGRDIRHELGLEPGHRVVSYIGRARRSKGLEMFVSLAASITDEQVRFLISTQRAGTTPDSYTQEELDALVARDPRILCIGFRPDVENVYASSDLILFPSQDEEPCAAVLLEAGVAGRVVIGTRTGSTPEFIQDGINGYLVDKEDGAGMARQVERLLNDPELRGRMETQARENAERRFTQAPAREVERIYDTLCQTRRQARTRP
jgi:glycosyltransferase involved in cell wall biosynthesis